MLLDDFSSVGLDQLVELVTGISIKAPFIVHCLGSLSSDPYMGSLIHLDEPWTVVMLCSLRNALDIGKSTIHMLVESWLIFFFCSVDFQL